MFIRLRSSMFVAFTVACAASVATLAAQADRRAEADQVTGTWTLTFKGPDAHGEMTGTLVIARAESGLSGTLSVHGQEIAFAGDFVKGELKLATKAADAHAGSTLTAKLSAPDTLTGYLSGPMGDVPMTGQRDKAGR